MPGTMLAHPPAGEDNVLDLLAKGGMKGVLSVPKLALDLPMLAMRGSDALQSKITGQPVDTANEPVYKGLSWASDAYDKALNSIVSLTPEQAASTPATIAETAGNFAAFPGGATKAVMEAPSLIGKAWRGLEHIINPGTVPGKIATGTALGAGVAAITPGQAEAAQPLKQDQSVDALLAPASTPMPAATPKLSAAWQPAPVSMPINKPKLSAAWRPIAAPIHPAEYEKGIQNQSDNHWNWIAASGAVAAAVALGLLTKGNTAKSTMNAMRSADSIFGKADEVVSPLTKGWRTKLVSGNIDQGVTLRDTMQKADPTLATAYGDRLTLAHPAAIAEKQATALRDGEIASTNTKLNSTVDIANAAAGLTQKIPNFPEKFGKYAYALDAMQGASSGKLTRLYEGWEKDVPGAVGLPEKAQRAAVKTYLQGVVDSVEQPRLKGVPNPDYSPDIMKLQMQLKQNYASVAEHLLKSGIIDKPTYLDWSTRDHMPMQAALDQGTWLQRVAKQFTLPAAELDPHDEWSALLERKNNDGERILPPIDAHEQYIRQAIRYTEQNSLKRQWIKSMLATPAGSELRKLITPVSNKAGVKQLISYKDAGVTKNFQVKDPYLYNALRFNPSGSNVWQIFNTTRKLMQAGTTGKGNPAFMFVSPIYDMWGMAAFGGLKATEAARLPYWAIRGAAKGLGATMARGMSQSLQAAMLANGTLPKLLGPQVTQHLITAGENAWRGSLLYKMGKVGAGGSVRAMDDAQIGQRLTMMRDLAPRYAMNSGTARSLKGLWSAYSGLYDAVQNSARLGYFEHFAGKNASLADLVKAGAKTRRVTGDFAQTGNSPFHKGMSAIFPYYNISMQSMAKMVHEFRVNPMKTSLAVTMGLAMPSIASVVYSSMMGKQYRDYYWKRLNSNDRASMMYLPIPGLPPERGLFIPVMPEWRPFHAMLANMTDALFGFQSGVVDTNRGAGFKGGLDSMFNFRMYQDVGAGATSGISTISMPPLANAALAAGGVRNTADLTNSLLPQFAQLHNENLSSLDSSGSVRGVFMPQKAEQIITALAGTVGRAFIDSAIAAQQAAHGGKPIIPNVAKAAVMNMTRSVPLSTTLWGLDRKLGANTPLDNRANTVIQQMKALAQSAGTDITNGGMAARGVFGAPIPFDRQFSQNMQPGAASNFKDQNIANIVSAAGLFMRLWTPHYGNQLNVLQKQIEGIRSSNSLSPLEKQKNMNRLYMKVQDVHKAALSSIEEDFVAPMQKQYGRDIDIGKITMDSTLEDFRPLTPQ